MSNGRQDHNLAAQRMFPMVGKSRRRMGILPAEAAGKCMPPILAVMLVGVAAIAHGRR